MGNKFFISDLHLGHKAILTFSAGLRGGSTIEEHDEWIIHQWNSVVTKRDMVYVLGDVAFGEDALKKVGRLKGEKQLIRGNHDHQSTVTYLKYFNNVFGLLKKHNVWLSHAPIHPIELRGKINVHGHVHHNTLLDQRYFNVSVEASYGLPVPLEEIEKRMKSVGGEG